MSEVIINGRFLTAPLTGVQRTAFEMVKALDELLDRGQLDNSIGFILLYAGVIKNPIRLKHIKVIKKGISTGNLWEQFELPVYSAGKLLINFCSIAPLLKRKQIIFIHDASTFANPQFFSRLFRSWYNFALPVLGKTARRIVTVSDFSKKELVRYGGFNPGKIEIIYNGADHVLHFGAPSDEFAKKIEQLKPYVLAVSSLGANKNFKRLSQAFQKVNFQNYQLLIAGAASGALQTPLPDGEAIYLGRVSDAELRYLYQQAELFVFPSFYEGFGIPPLEAMILGCPVAASHSSAMPEILGDAAAYFNPLEADDIAAKINSLINDEMKCEQLRKDGYQKARGYAWEKSASDLYNLILKYHG